MAYFYEHENPHAPRRDNGKRFWGYPSRRGKDIQLVVIHTAENLPDRDGDDQGAEAVARYGATTSRPASWHHVVDSDSIIECLPQDAVAFHARGVNSVSLGLEIATQAKRWGEDPAHDTKLLANAAHVAGVWCRTHNIPVRKVTPYGNGITSHAEIDPKRRSDPGPDFPWDRFIEMTQRVADGQSPIKEDKMGDSKPEKSKPAPAPKGITVDYPNLEVGAGKEPGAVRSAVKRAQALANLTGKTSLAADGKYGPLTRQGIAKVQTLYGLKADGVVGKATWKALLTEDVS